MERQAEMTRRDTASIVKAAAENPQVVRMELVAHVDRPDAATAWGETIAAGFFGLLWALPLAFVGYFSGRGNAELAAYGFCIGMVVGSLFRSVTIMLPRLQKDTLTFDPARPEAQPTAAPFIETLNEGHRREIVLFPAGWDIDTMRRYARHAKAGDAYDIAYNKRPEWVTEEMLKALREWMAARDYGTEQGSTRPWLWHERGVAFMDGLVSG